MIKKLPTLFRTQITQRLIGTVVVLFVAIIGTYLLVASHAATPYASSEAENGTLAGSATKQTDPNASGGSSNNYVRFGNPSTGGGNNMVVGINEGGWGTSGTSDISNIVKYARYDQSGGEAISDYSGANVKINVAYTGDSNGSYNTGGVSAINITNWVSSALSWYGSSGCTVTECPSIEILNEPDGSWFWGSNASSQANATAYANLIKATYIAFHNQYGSNAPLVLGDYDSDTWGGEWWSSNISSYVDGVIVHPYGGTGNVTASALGNHQLVIDAHNNTGKPVYVTEVGWPTAVGQPATGDSLQWSQSTQADNIYNFIVWARSTNYVNAVYIFGYRDYGTNAFYGVEQSNGTKKPSYNALKCAANNLVENCP